MIGLFVETSSKGFLTSTLHPYDNFLHHITSYCILCPESGCKMGHLDSIHGEGL